LGSGVLAHVSPGQHAVLTGRSFFPKLISASFSNGLHAAFDFAIGACLVAAGASWLRGGKYVYREPASEEQSTDQDAGDRRELEATTAGSQT
jgi:hypothetical protein